MSQPRVKVEGEVPGADAVPERAGDARIGVLKCDIEGAEAEVFADCSSWIDRVDAMSVECHLDVMSTDALLSAVEANGDRVSVRHGRPIRIWDSTS